MNILSVALVIFLLNLPFGYWRANEKKLSPRWFLSIHAPVPLVIVIRVLSGLGWQFITFPIMVGAFFGGQFAGGRIHRMRRSRSGARVSSCLVWDLLNNNQKS
jgi:hypothetical protein